MERKDTMAGLLDYLRWRGDLSYKQAEFNSCDAGLLATIAYWPFEKEDVGHSLRHATKKRKNLKRTWARRPKKKSSWSP